MTYSSGARWTHKRWKLLETPKQHKRHVQTPHLPVRKTQDTQDTWWELICRVTTGSSSVLVLMSMEGQVWGNEIILLQNKVTSPSWCRILFCYAARSLTAHCTLSVSTDAVWKDRRAAAKEGSATDTLSLSPSRKAWRSCTAWMFTHRCFSGMTFRRELIQKCSGGFFVFTSGAQIQGIREGKDDPYVSCGHIPLLTFLLWSEWQSNILAGWISWPDDKRHLGLCFCL